MKGISTIIATILLVVITISLVSTAYLFVGGVLTGSISKVITLVDAKAHRVIVRNDGTDTVASDEISIIVNGQQVDIVNPQSIDPKDTVTLRFVPPEPDMTSARVNVMGTSNTLSYTTDIVPSESKVTADTAGLWHLNGNADDETGVNDGTNNGATPTTDCVIGSCLSFDGLSHYVEINDDSSLQSDYVTVEAWVWLNGAGTGHQRFVQRANNANEGGWSLQANGAATVFQWYVRVGGSWYVATTPTITGEWVHLAGTYNGTILRIYKNGEPADGNTVVGVISTPTSPNNRFMADNDLNAFVNGKLDEVHIYNKALTQEEILDSMYG